MAGSPSSSGPVTDYESNVFVNCPFDKQYLPLLRPLLFTVVYLGFNPRIATERSDAGESRLDKICELVRESRYSIHDLSRLKSRKSQEFYRLNMPFELGIDYGARQYGPLFMAEKRCLILEKSDHDFKKALSDLSGVDIKSHNNEPTEVVRSVRDWFLETVGLRDAEYFRVIWSHFSDFTAVLYESKLAEGIPEDDVTEDIEKMPIPEYLNCANEWFSKNRTEV